MSRFTVSPAFRAEVRELLDASSVGSVRLPEPMVAEYLAQRRRAGASMVCAHGHSLSVGSVRLRALRRVPLTRQAQLTFDCLPCRRRSEHKRQKRRAAGLRF